MAARHLKKMYPLPCIRMNKSAHVEHTQRIMPGVMNWVSNGYFQTRFFETFNPVQSYKNAWEIVKRCKLYSRPQCNQHIRFGDEGAVSTWQEI